MSGQDNQAHILYLQVMCTRARSIYLITLGMGVLKEKYSVPGSIKHRYLTEEGESCIETYSFHRTQQAPEGQDEASVGSH